MRYLSVLLALILSVSFFNEASAAKLSLESKPQAQVEFNGKKIGQTPITLILKKNQPAQITLTADDHSPLTRTFTLKAKEHLRYLGNLPPESSKHLIIQSNPSGAEIWINHVRLKNKQGRPVKTPAKIYAEGDYQLGLKASRGRMAHQKIQIDDDDNRPLNVDLVKAGVDLIVKIGRAHV